MYIGLAKAAFPSVALFLALAACSEDSGGVPPAQTGTPIQVVVTTNIMADWVEIVGGDRVEVFSLVPEGADPHSFQPGAQDIARIADADLVLSVGLRLEESWLKELLENAARDPAGIVEMGELIDPIEFAETHAEDVEFLESLAHIVDEVEEGEISPEEGLEDKRVDGRRRRPWRWKKRKTNRPPWCAEFSARLKAARWTPGKR